MLNMHRNTTVHGSDMGNSLPEAGAVPKWSRMKLFLVSAIFVSAALSVHSATITAVSAAAADVQAAVDRAADGDTVVVNPSSATWTSGQGVVCSKGITLSGTGVTITASGGTQTLVNVTTNASAAFRLTGFAFNDSRGGLVFAFKINGGFGNAKYRVDHCTFNATTQKIFYENWNAWGVIDHCVFVGDDASEMIHNMGYGAGVTTGWSEDVVAGSPDALYIEDCTFSKTNQSDQYFWGTSAIQSYYGARTVIRHCTFNYCQVDQHGTPGVIGARWWEIYENDFYCPSNSGQSNWMAIRGGSGVIFNNRMHVGSGATDPAVELVEEDAGYPALYQIGRGKNQSLDPAYCWNNGKIPGSGSSNVVDGRDFYSNTSRPGYSPYTYPHPLQSGSTPTTLPAPSNTRVVASP